MNYTGAFCQILDRTGMRANTLTGAFRSNPNIRYAAGKYAKPMLFVRKWLCLW